MFWFVSLAETPSWELKVETSEGGGGLRFLFIGEALSPETTQKPAADRRSSRRVKNNKRTNRFEVAMVFFRRG